MLPLKCFNCDGIGHFASKFTIVNNKGSDEEEDPKKKRKIKRETREETKINYSRRVSTQRNTTPHQTRMMIVILIQIEYSSWK
jgi:hypothetical protein